MFLDGTKGAPVVAKVVAVPGAIVVVDDEVVEMTFEVAEAVVTVIEAVVLAEVVELVSATVVPAEAPLELTDGEGVADASGEAELD